MPTQKSLSEISQSKAKVGGKERRGGDGDEDHILPLIIIIIVRHARTHERCDASRN